VIYKYINPKKPTKWGLKVYVLADRVTLYIKCNEPYYSSEIIPGFPTPQTTFATRIVLHLFDKFLNAIENFTGILTGVIQNVILLQSF
jgi:hypothetical protein